MIRKLLLIVIFYAGVSCNQGKSGKETDNADLTHTPKDTPTIDNSGEPDSPFVQRLFFERYYVIENNKPRFIFRDTAFNEYEFGSPGQNNLGGIDLLRKNSSNPEDYKQNDAMVDKWFVATIATKTVDTYNNYGEPARLPRWRIIDLKEDTTERKTLVLVFDGYEEGDYPHFLFTDPVKQEQYDFGPPQQNDYDAGNVGDYILKKDERAASGYVADPRFIGKKYRVIIDSKLVDTYDDNGNPERDFRWRFVSFRRE